MNIEQLIKYASTAIAIASPAIELAESIYNELSSSEIVIPDELKYEVENTLELIKSEIINRSIDREELEILNEKVHAQ